MSFEKFSQLRNIPIILPAFWKRHIDIIVQDHQQTGFGAEIQYSIKGGVVSTLQPAPQFLMKQILYEW
jgi:hypothetical protein